jgi:sialic acid synthase SpsE
MKNFQIGQIDLSKEVLVIPEIGINHNGSLSAAKEIVLSAYRAGAKIVKFQTHIVDDEMSALAKKTIPGNASISIYEIMKKCSLTEAEDIEIKKYVESLGMVYLSTPFSRAAADRLHRMNVSAYKIGSGEMNNYPLLDYVASFGKPMIVSTGMNDLASVKKAALILENRHVPYCFLHTTNLYPTQPEQVRLGAMQEMMKTFPEVFIGLSDHMVTNNAAYAALAFGARVIERHYTDTKKRNGPDIVCSMDEDELRRLIVASKEIPLMLGGKKEPLAAEQVTIDFAFSTLVTISAVKKGEVFTMKNLWAKRPGIGQIRAERLNDVIGKHAACDIANDTQLTYDMIAEKI